MVAVFLPEGSQKCGMFLCWIIIWIGFSEPLALSALATCVGEDQVSEEIDEEDLTLVVHVFFGVFCGQMACNGWNIEFL